MNALEVGQKLKAMLDANQGDAALDTLYADNVVSVEPNAMPGASPEAHGLAALKAKHQWWFDNHEVHKSVTTGPWPHGDRFILGFDFEVTMKQSGARIAMTDMGLYTVVNGKIAREEFFYPPDA
jgi:hypothetical protein